MWVRSAKMHYKVVSQALFFFLRIAAEISPVCFAYGAVQTH